MRLLNKDASGEQPPRLHMPFHTHFFWGGDVFATPKHWKLRLSLPSLFTLNYDNQPVVKVDFQSKMRLVFPCLRKWC